MNSFLKSKFKIKLLMISFSIIIAIGILLLLLFALKTNSKTIYLMLIVTSIIFYFTSLPAINKQYKQKLEVNDEYLIFKDNTVTICIKYEMIQSIKYNGTRIIPISEILLIQSNKDIIYIDFNFISYLHVWESVINICKLKNPNITIDDKVYKRLKHFSKQ